MTEPKPIAAAPDPEDRQPDPVGPAVVILVKREGNSAEVEVAIQGDVRPTEITSLLDMAVAKWATQTALSRRGGP